MCSNNAQLFVLKTSKGRRKLAIGLYDFDTARFSSSFIVLSPSH